MQWGHRSTSPFSVIMSAYNWNPAELLDAFQSLDNVWDMPITSPQTSANGLEYKQEQQLHVGHFGQEPQGSTSGSDSAQGQEGKVVRRESDSYGGFPMTGGPPSAGWGEQAHIQQMQQQQQQQHAELQQFMRAPQSWGALPTQPPQSPAQMSAPASKGGKRTRAAPKGGAKAQLEELQAVVAEKQHQISRLVGDNSRLRQRARVLELVVRCRSEQVERLQQLAAASGPRPLAPAPSGGSGGPAETAEFHAAWTVRMNGKTLEDMMAEFRLTVSALSEALLDAPGSTTPTPRLTKIMDAW